MADWTKVAVFVCLLCASGCATDDDPQAKGRPDPREPRPNVAQPPRRPAPGLPAGETIQAYGPPVDVPVTLGGDPDYRPTSIDQGFVAIEGIRWKTYGDSTAVGTGISDGKRVTIRLRALDICNHKLTYMEWAIDRVGSRKKPRFDTILGTHESIDVCDPEPNE
jgi:hypothetical protein